MLVDMPDKKPAKFVVPQGWRECRTIEEARQFIGKIVTTTAERTHPRYIPFEMCVGAILRNPSAKLEDEDPYMGLGDDTPPHILFEIGPGTVVTSVYAVCCYLTLDGEPMGVRKEAGDATDTPVHT